MNGIRTIPPEISNCEKKKRSYKLLIDPALKKGTEKVYRIDGVVPGHESLYPPVQVRDPRSRLAMLWTKTEAADLVVPRFKIDVNYVGQPPPVQVTISNLNDNINKQFLDDMLKKFGAIEESHIFYHPKTRKHLRLAHVTFTTTQSARFCIEKLNNTSVMGDVLTVYLDPFGKDCHRLFEDSISGKSQTSSFGEQNVVHCDPRSNDPRRRISSFDKDKPVVDSPLKKLSSLEISHSRSSIELLTPLSSEKSLSTTQASEKSYVEIGSCDSASTSSLDCKPAYVHQSHGHTPSNKPTNLLKSHQKNSGWDKKPLLQWGEVSSSWEGNSSPAWESRNSKKHITPPTTPLALPKQSPIRESLDSRIELLLKQNDGKGSFLDLGAFSPEKKLGDCQNKNFVKSDKLMRPPSDPSWINNAPPLPPDSSPLPPLPENDEPPPPPPDDDNSELLSNPPSPFISVSEYHKWALFTQDIDKGRSSSLTQISKGSVSHFERLDLKSLRLTDVQWKVEADNEKHYDLAFCHMKGDSTPVRDEPPDDVLRGIESDDDDKMSLSSLSSGEDKLEVNAPPLVDNINLSATVPVGSSDNLNYSQTQVAGSNFHSLYSSQPVAPSLYPMSDASQYSSSVYPTFSNSASTAYPAHAPPAAIYVAPSTRFPSPVSYSASEHSAPAVAVPPLPPPPPPPHTFLAAAAAPSHAHQPSPTNHPMYPSEQVQLMARMGIWRPGMGSAVSASINDPSKLAFSGQSYPQNYSPQNYYTRLSPRPPGLYPPVSPHIPNSFSSLVSRPPPGYPLLTAPKNPDGTYSSPLLKTRIPQEEESQFCLKNDPNIPTVNSVLESVVKELKQVMKKDLCKRMIEASAFKTFEKWWDDHHSQVKVQPDGGVLTNKDTNKETNKEPEKSILPALTALFDKNSNSNSFGFGLDSMGIGLGLRATMPKMPSFRRKIIKPPSPPPLYDDDSKRADYSDNDKDRLSDSDTESSYGLRQRHIVPSTEEDQSTQGSESEKAESDGESSSAEESSDQYESSSEGSMSETEESGSELETGEEEEEEVDVTSEAVHSAEVEICTDEKVDDAHTSDVEKVDTVEVDAKSNQGEEIADERNSTFEDLENEEEKINTLVIYESSQPEAFFSKEEECSKYEVVDDEELMETSAIHEDVETVESTVVVPPVEASELIPETSANEDSRAIEASQALMALASCFTDFGSIEPSVQEVIQSTLQTDGYKALQTDDDKAPETDDMTLHTTGDKALQPDSAIDDTSVSSTVKDADRPSNLRIVTDLWEYGYQNKLEQQEIPDASKLEIQNSFISQVLAEHNYSIPTFSKQELAAAKAQVDEKLSSVDSIIESVARGPQIVVDHEYTRLTTSPVEPPEPSLPVLEEKRQRTKRKRRSLHHYEPIVEQPRRTYDKRNLVEEMNILYEFLKTGIEPEDVHYLKKSYGTLIEDVVQLYWLNDTHWVDHPPYVHSPPKKKKKESEYTKVHISGSARTEGYYKIDVKDKAVYNHGATTSPYVEGEIQDSSNKAKTTAQSSREARSNQRRLLTSFGEADFTSDLLKFNQLKFRKKQLKFARSRIHDWGLFALEPIAADEMVIEYVGQMVRPVVADLRETKYTELGIGSSYLFRVDLETIIDATKCGNLARFINHSCNPNCYAKIITVEGQKKIVIYSKQPINVNEEITYDYKFPIEEEKIPCLCGAPQCRRYLN